MSHAASSRPSPFRAGAALVAVLIATTLLAGCSSEPTRARTTPEPTASGTVSAIAPAADGLTGGTTVTLSGQDLAGVTRVTFDGVDATDLHVVDDRTLSVVAPHAAEYRAGIVDVVAHKGGASVPTAPDVDFAYRVSSPVDREMQYAFRHWKSSTYNTAFMDYNDIGGDCQNFVSQSLQAAGLQRKTDWYYESSTAHGYAWGFAPAFDQMLRSAPDLGFTALGDDRGAVQIGDLAYFDRDGNGTPDHVMIVSEVDRTDRHTGIKLVGHNRDADYRDLDQALHDQPQTDVWFWGLPASFRA